MRKFSSPDSAAAFRRKRPPGHNRRAAVFGLPFGMQRLCHGKKGVLGDEDASGGPKLPGRRDRCAESADHDVLIRNSPKIGNRRRWNSALGLLFSNRVNKKRIVGHRTKIEKTRKRMKTPVRPRYLPPPYQDSAESGRLILAMGPRRTFAWPARKTAKLCGLSSNECRLNPADYVSSPQQAHMPNCWLPCATIPIQNRR